MSDTALGTQIVSWLSLALVVGGIVIGTVNHKRIKSQCCRHEASVSLDIENTTPKGDKVEALKSSSPDEKKEPSS